MNDTFEGSTFKSGAKITILDEYTDIYTDILGSGWPHDLWYIETHAGSGLIDTGDYKIDGSTITILKNYLEDFERFYFYEKKNSRFETLVNKLQERFGWEFNVSPLKPTKKDFDVARLNDPYIRIMNADCNENAPFLAQESNKNNHWLVFVDQKGPTVKLETLESILNRGNMDILITFPTTGIHRNVNNKRGKPRVDDQYGGENYTQDATMDQRVDEFVELLESRFSEGQVISRPLQWPKKSHQRFDLVFASRDKRARELAKGRMQQEDLWDKARDRLGYGNIDSWG